MAKKKQERKELKTWECEFEGPDANPPWVNLKFLTQGFNLNHAIKKAKKKARIRIVNPRLVNAKQLLTDPNKKP
tara:strand:- start:370 stop:591 length:222 start_codon:yes stop_codon:yes gene_type:complete